MPAERVSMRRVREILRLKFECGASDRAIAVAVAVARSTVQLCLARVAAAGLTWPLPATLTDHGLEAVLFAPRGGSQPGIRHKAEPDWAAIHKELRRGRWIAAICNIEPSKSQRVVRDLGAH